MPTKMIRLALCGEETGANHRIFEDDQEIHMANPALKDKTLLAIRSDHTSGARMSKRGVLGALSMFASLVVAGAAAGWIESSGSATPSGGLLLVALLGSFALAMVIMRTPRLARSLGFVYSIVEGFLLGVISQSYNAQYHGIVLEAVGVTAGVALSVWFLYGTGVVKVTSKTYRVVGAATLGALAFYGVSLLMMVFGGPNLDGGGGAIGVGISLVLALVAAANFLVDLDQVDRLVASGADAQYDWYMAFAMMVSLIWLYLEVLNLLGKGRR